MHGLRDSLASISQMSVVLSATAMITLMRIFLLFFLIINDLDLNNNYSFLNLFMLAVVVGLQF